MKSNQPSQDKIISRLNRVEGQIKGIKGMYHKGEDCLAIIQQVAAARQALARVGKDLLTNEAVRCSRSPKKQPQFDQILKSLFEVS